jgi:hypothetical protein
VYTLASLGVLARFLKLLLINPPPLLTCKNAFRFPHRIGREEVILSRDEIIEIRSCTGSNERSYISTDVLYTRPVGFFLGDRREECSGARVELDEVF